MARFPLFRPSLVSSHSRTTRLNSGPERERIPWSSRSRATGRSTKRRLCGFRRISSHQVKSSSSPLLERHTESLQSTLTSFEEVYAIFLPSKSTIHPAERLSLSPFALSRTLLPPHLHLSLLLPPFFLSYNGLPNSSCSCCLFPPSRHLRLRQHCSFRSLVSTKVSPT